VQVARFVVRRLALGLLALAGITFATFWLFESQDPTLAQVENHPSVLHAYWLWVKGLWGGPTFHLLTLPAPARLNTTLSTSVLSALGHTAVLLGYALLLVVVFSVAVAVIASRGRGTAVDITMRSASYVMWAAPAFLLAMLVQLFMFHVSGDRGIGPFPLAGWPGSCPGGLGIDSGVLAGCPSAGSGIRYGLNVMRYMTFPAVVLALGFIGLHGRYLRSALFETLDAPFITTARAKGVSERGIVFRHALRASLVTFVTVLLADFGAIFGAAMAVDWVYQLNGLGTVFISEFPTDFGSINTYSLELVILIMGACVILASVLSEIVAFWLDPRVRAEQ